ncbi:putative hydrolase of the HAD superfamily [Catalinimonas alkaloidigena]|uniref:Putative hydrolase of the HAD superfamily n=1 Tax=Catalinimonas alkaloidigena TaxID=1075417 RepID=A0A1G9MPW4_9BACT|nr:YjjG family noncanonical pyrimidine nucleotidase [Catalinimonas alkaloidigena]SDL76154.1 putative hydrolase of the HAD superfamily [Catalinimonas alkaloidigena]
MLRYQHLFFDLDHTLWDFDRNSADTLRELFHEFRIADLCTASCEVFIERYRIANELIWEQYRQDLITKEVLRDIRFQKVLTELGVAEKDHPPAMGSEYLRRCPTKTSLLPYTHEVLQYLLGQGYVLHILTNGFEDTQRIKLEGAQLRAYFTHVVTSESCGFKKPHECYFRYALTTTQAHPAHCLMIGDSLEADILGAQRMNLDTVYVNFAQSPHDAAPTYEVACLSELMQIL